MCLGRFTSSGGDPAGVVNRVLSSNKRVLLAPTDGESTTFSKPGVDTVIVLWNPLDDVELSSGKKQDPCATLYHELSHADAAQQGQDSDDPCGDTGISKAEAKATLKENQYRGAQGLPQREKYDEHPLPKSDADCDKPPKKPRPPNTGPSKRGHGLDGGRSTGDPHVTTFDRARYDLMGVGEYVLARTDSVGFAVQVRSRPFVGSRTVSVNSVAAMDVHGDRVSVVLSGLEPVLRVAGADAVATFEHPLSLAHGGTVEAIELYGHRGYVIEWPDGSAVQVLSVSVFALDVTVAPAPALRGQLMGLLGNFDGNPANDLTGRDGTRYKAPMSFDALYRHYSEGWRVRPAESLFEYGPGQTTSTFTDSAFPDRPVDPSTVAGLDAAAAACRRLGLQDAGRVSECAYDVAVTGRLEFASAAVGEEVSAATTTVSTPTTVASHAGQTKDITYDREVSGTILEAGQVDTFRLEVPGGAMVVFVRGLQPCDGARLLLMEVSDPSGVLRDVGQACRGLGRQVLTEAGRWTITVHGAAVTSKDGPTSATGPYRFTVAKIGTDTSGSTALNQTVTGSIRAPGQIDTTTLHVAAGQIIYVRGAGCTPQSPGLTVVLKDPSGTAVNLSRSCDGFGRQRLATGGDWTLEVSGSDGQTGDYRFEVLAVRPDRLVATAAGQRLSGAIEAPGVNDIFAFDALAGQVVYLRSLEACTDANSSVRLVLVDPNGSTTDIAQACHGLRREELRSAGKWKVVVSADRDARGTYRMELLGVRADHRQRVDVGQTVEGVIEQVGARDRWTFVGSEGERVQIRGLATCSPADLRWQLVDPKGTVADLGRLCEPGPSVSTLRVAGEWTILVGASADGTGTYQLGLERPT